MLKQSPSRNQRTKGFFKLKQGIQIFALIAVGIWLLYQIKHSLDKKSYEEYSEITKKLGRKGLQPWINKPFELMDDTEETESQRVKERSSGREDYVIGHDRDRIEEEEPEEVEDLIDVEDKEKEEENEDEDRVEDMSLLEDQGHNEVDKDTQSNK